MTAPVPPVTGSDWQPWARQLRTFLQRGLSLLQRKDGDSRAAEDGIILWDAANGYPVISTGGDFEQIPVFGNVPASASATGTAGQMAWDADYIYVCTATDTWKRVALSTW